MVPYRQKVACGQAQFYHRYKTLSHHGYISIEKNPGSFNAGIKTLIAAIMFNLV
jgi:hypothetical protein